MSGPLVMTLGFLVYCVTDVKTSSLVIKVDERSGVSGILHTVHPRTVWLRRVCMAVSAVTIWGGLIMFLLQSG